MFRHPIHHRAVFALALSLAIAFSAMLPAIAHAESLTIYSGRSKSLVQPLIKQFEAETGIEVKVRYGKTAQLHAALMEEGEQSPADVFWSQDAGALGALATAGFFTELPGELTDKLPELFRNSSGLWVATSGRARVLAYAPERVSADELPESVFDLTDVRYKGRVGWAPTNASFQSFVTAMRAAHGEEATRDWLTAMMKNDTKIFPKNTPIIQGLAAGEIDFGLPNHYYLLRFQKSDKKYPVEQTFFGPHDIGNLVNIAGVGILKSSSKNDTAKKFVAFLLSDKAQQYFTSDTFEYPLTGNVIPNPKLVEKPVLLASAPDVKLDDLSDLQGTLDLLREVGLI